MKEKEKIELSRDAKFLFFSMMQAAIKMKEMGKEEKDFLYFAHEIWESMELSPIEYLKKMLLDGMIQDIKDLNRE